MPRVLIADPFNQGVKEEFIQEWGVKGYEVVYKPSLKGEALTAELAAGNYDALIVGMKDVKEEMLQAWREKKPGANLCVIRAGSEPSHIDHITAAELGIAVMNTPGASKDPVVKYVKERLPENGKGKTLAIIGYGEIGKDIVKEAIKRGFRVQVYSSHLTPIQAETEGVIYAGTTAAALKKADFVAISTHLVERAQANKINQLAGTPVVSPSAGIIDRGALSGLNKGAHIINISRPWICNIADLQEAQRCGQVGQVDFNTGSHDIEKLKNSCPDFCAGETTRIDLASNFMTAEASRNLGVQAVKRLIGFHENGQVITPLFNGDLWRGKQRRSFSTTVTREAPPAKRQWDDKGMSKERVVFVGAGIESLVSVMEFARQTLGDGTRGQYELIVVEKEPEAACGTTFCNGGNFTNIEGLTGLKLGSTSLTRLHKSLTGDQNSDGWLTTSLDEMTVEQREWALLSHKLASKKHADIYQGAAQIITDLGQYSVAEAQSFFSEFPHLRQAAHFQYQGGENTWLVRIHDKPERARANYEYFKGLGTNVIPLSYDDMLVQQPGLSDAAIRDKMIASGGVGMKGGCINAREFTRGLAKTLQREHDVIFHYNTQANDIELDSHGRAVGIRTSKDFIRADQLVVSTGVDTSLFKGKGIYVPVQPIGGCTLTVPIPKHIPHYPRVPFKVISDDGVIVFSPHLPEGESKPTELRIGGMYWYDPQRNKDLSSPQAQYGTGRIKEYLRQVFPVLYGEAHKQNTFNEWVGFRPYTPDNVPIIDKVTEVNGRKCQNTGIWMNMGHGPGGTSYSFASAQLLVARMQGKSLDIPGTKPEDFALSRFEKYKQLDQAPSHGTGKKKPHGQERQYSTYARPSLSDIPSSHVLSVAMHKGATNDFWQQTIRAGIKVAKVLAK